MQQWAQVPALEYSINMQLLHPVGVYISLENGCIDIYWDFSAKGYQLIPDEITRVTLVMDFGIHM